TWRGGAPRVRGRRRGVGKRRVPRGSRSGGRRRARGSRCLCSGGSVRGAGRRAERGSGGRGNRPWSNHGDGGCRRSREALWRFPGRSEEHTSELQSRENIVCRLLLEKKKDSARACWSTSNGLCRR